MNVVDSAVDADVPDCLDFVWHVRKNILMRMMTVLTHLIMPKHILGDSLVKMIHIS